MRMRLVIISAALLACAIPAAAQQESAKDQVPAIGSSTAPAPSTQPVSGWFDIGFRGSSNTGDYARYERYRDLRDGTHSFFTVSKDTDQYQFSGSASNIGYHDQRYLANYHNGPARVSFGWTSTPLNYTYLSKTPWIEASPGTYTLDSAARFLVQQRAAGVVGIPSNAVQLQTPSLYRSLATGFDLQSRRDTASIALAYDATREVGFNATFSTAKKTGYQPWGASFAFNNANELPLPLDNRTNDMSAGLEWSHPKGMVRVGYDGSFFNNDIQELVWDNPLRATDFTPFDPSGYSNGNGPARGRMSLAPSNKLNTVSGTGLYKMPAHTTINGTLSYTSMNQNEPLIPWTINPAIANAAVYQSFPGLAHLERGTAEAVVHAVNGSVNFTSRPNRYVGFTARYRFNDHRNQTPLFDAREYVRFDAVPEETGGETGTTSECISNPYSVACEEMPAFNIRQNTFDVNATLNAAKYVALRVGYGHDQYDRTGRAFATVKDNTVRASLDTIGSQYVTVRGIYEFTQRRGSGFSEEAITEGGGQPTLRFFDDADRDRNKGTVVFSVNPVDFFDVTFSVAAAKDDYTGQNHYFGLLDNTNTSYNIGFNVFPLPDVGIGANYGRDRYTANQRSRNANPPPDLQFNDPSRDWSLNNEENVNNFNAYLDLPKVIRNVDVRFNVDFSDSDNGFIFGGPRIDSLAASNTFVPLPNVTNKWQRYAADVKYYFSKRVGVAGGYWYEKFDVSDFATVDLPGESGTPRIDYLGELSTGYGNRPYKGSTGFVRLLYLF